jgi:hypothetical protein
LGDGVSLVKRRALSAVAVWMKRNDPSRVNRAAD